MLLQNGAGAPELELTFGKGEHMLETNLVYTYLQANHHMWTKARLNTSTGWLEANTRTATFTWFGGFKGNVQIALVDSNGYITYQTQAHRYGVDGTLIGRNDRTDLWDESIPPDVVARTASLIVIHFWAEDWITNLNQWLTIGKQIGAAVADIYRALRVAGVGA